MKHITAIILSLALLFILAIPSFATENERLSDMTEGECIEFVKLYGIAIPSDYDEATWGPFVKKIIEIVEIDPDHEFAFSYSVTLSFANSIKAAVNDYYGIHLSDTSYNPARTYNPVMLAETTLEDSEKLGDWLPIYDYYNCYVFALGLPEHPLYAFRDPGYYSNQDFSIMFDLSYIVDLVETDLVYLHHSRIHTSTQLDISNLCVNEQVICLRRGQFDYHFMKLAADDWLHKPGSSALLRYLHTPENSLYWTNEGLFEEGYLPGDIVYNSEIIYISYDGHDWQYTYNSNGTHTKSCSICGDAFTSECNYIYSYTGNNKHNASCVDCGNEETGVSCTIATTCNDNGTHTVSCDACSNTSTEGCDLEYTNINNTRHSVRCTVCDYYVNSQLCSLTYTSRGNKTHTASCSQCNNSYTGNCSITYSYLSSNQHRGSCNKCSYTHTASCYYMTAYCGNATLGDVHKTQCQTCGHISGSATTACSFAIKSNGNNTHSNTCTQCGYVKAGPTACVYKSDNTCKFCGALKNSAVINDLEEQETQ